MLRPQDASLQFCPRIRRFNMLLRSFVLFLAVACLTAAAPSSSKEDSSEESTTVRFDTIPGKAPTSFVTPEIHRSRRDTTSNEPDRRPLTKPSPAQTDNEPQHSTTQQHKRDTTSHETDHRPLTKPSAPTGNQPQHSITQHKRSAEETPRPDHSQLTKPAQPIGSKTGQAGTFDIKHKNKRETPTKEERPQNGPSVQPVFPSPPQHDGTFDIKRKEKRDTSSEEHVDRRPLTKPAALSSSQPESPTKTAYKRDTSSEEHVNRRPLTKPFPAPSSSQPEPPTKTEHKRETTEKKPQTHPPVVSTLPARPVDTSKPQH